MKSKPTANLDALSHDMKKYEMLDTMLEGIQIIGFDWRYLYVNDTLALHGKSSKEELLGHTIMERYPGIENTEMFQKLRRCMEKREPQCMENQFTYPDGSVGYFELRIQPVPEGISVLSLDISLRKQAELALATRNQELESMNKELRQFANIASHDLQEPLRTINCYLELLHHKYTSHFDDHARLYMDMVLQASDRMGRLIQGLLSYSNIGRNRELTTVDCNEVLEHLRNDLAITLETNQVQLEVEPLPTLVACEVELQQLFQNLLLNAIKYRHTERAPEIRIWAEPLETSWLFAVQDNGMGMHSDSLERIFEMFQRLHTQSEYSGVGIGLSICNKIVELHQGRLWCNSTLDQGSTFFFTLSHALTNEESP